MKARHDGDCTIYSLLINGMPEDGICTCGYGHQRRAESPGDMSDMYSEERLHKMWVDNGSPSDEEVARRVDALAEKLGWKKDE